MIANRMHLFSTWLLPLALLPTLCAPAVAELIFFQKARIDNTTLADGTPLRLVVNGFARDPSDVNKGGPGANDGFWSYRSPFGNEGNVLTAHNSPQAGADPTPTLRLPIEGLEPGSLVEVFVFFWDSPPGRWSIRAALNPDSLVQFDRETEGARKMFPNELGDETLDEPIFSDTLFTCFDDPTTGTVIVAEANRRLHAASVGIVTVGDDGTIELFANGLEGEISNFRRTWFEGAGIRRIR